MLPALNLKPDCVAGYTVGQIEELFPGSSLKKFVEWIKGQPHSICDGRIYNYNTERYEYNGCGPHGEVYYTKDVEQALALFNQRC
jgi:hypothetical protein